MATTLQEILGYRNLCGITQKIITGIPENILPAAFMTETLRVEKDSGVYKTHNGNRKAAGTVNYGSPSQTVQQIGLREVPFKCIHSFEEMYHDMAILEALESYDSPEKQEKGMQEISRQVREFSSRFRNLRLIASYSALANGAIYLDSAGKILPNSTGADSSRTIEFSVPSTNTGHLKAIDGVTDIIGGSWATDTTDIAGHIKTIKDTARKRTGYPIRYAFYGANVIGYITKNQNLKNLVNGSSNNANAFLGNEIPDGFLGLKWRSASECFMEDADGDVHDIFTGDMIVFTPDPAETPDFWDFAVGSYSVPNSINVVSDAVAASSMFTKVYGGFSFAHTNLNPPGIRHCFGDTFLPILRCPESIFIADVT